MASRRLILLRLLRRRRMGSRHDAGAALVFEPVAFAGDLHDSRVVEDAVEHGGGEDRVAA